MKYAPEGYTLTAASLKKMKTKLNVFRQYTPARKYVEAVLVTSNGVVKNQYSAEILNYVTGDQLFKP